MQIQTLCHVRKLKNSNAWWFLYLVEKSWKLQFMHTEKCQIWNFGSEDVSKEYLTDLFRKDVAEFNDMFYHFEYATMEMLAESFNNYSVLKLRIFHQQPYLFCLLQKRLRSMLCNYSGQQITYFIIELPRNKVDQCLSSFSATALFIRQPFFLWKFN